MSYDDDAGTGHLKPFSDESKRKSLEKLISPEAFEKAATIATELFKNDFVYMIEELQEQIDWVEKEGLTTIYQKYDDPTKYSLGFKGFALENPHDPFNKPVLFIRPNEEEYSWQGLYSKHPSVDHPELFYNWKRVSQLGINPKRTELFNLLGEPYDERPFHHVYFILDFDADTRKFSLTFRGLSTIFDEQHAQSDILKFISTLQNYGIKSMLPSLVTDKIEVENLVLADQLTPVIEADAQLLEKYSSKNKVELYKRLAKKFKLQSKLGKEHFRERVLHQALDAVNTDDDYFKNTMRKFDTKDQHQEFTLQRFEQFVAEIRQHERIKKIRKDRGLPYDEVLPPSVLEEFADVL